ncbi:MAG: isochorismatase family protein [Pirellulaceae bacterium]
MNLSWQAWQAGSHAPIVVKEYADSFEKTNLEETLRKLGVTELLVGGMMTQNCVTHTAISKAAEKYDVTILPDAGQMLLGRLGF